MCVIFTHKEQNPFLLEPCFSLSHSDLFFTYFYNNPTRKKTVKRADKLNKKDIQGRVLIFSLKRGLSFDFFVFVFQTLSMTHGVQNRSILQLYKYKYKVR